MKRFLVILLFLMLLVSSLYACNSDKYSGQKFDDELDNTSLSSNKTDGLYEDYDIINLSDGCFNNYGYYNFSGSLIYFFDVETNQRVVLCNNPNCAHNSDECNAFISSKETVNKGPSFFVNQSATFIFSKKDRIYLFLTDGTLLSVKYDGTEHKTVAKIDSKYTFDKAYMIGDEIIIYSFYSEHERGEIVEKACFIKYNIITNEWKQTNTFNRNLTGDSLIGITKDETAIFYHDDEIPEIPKGTSINEAIQISRNTKCKLYSMNINTSEKTIIYEGEIGDCSPVTMLNGEIYFHSQNEECLRTMDFKTGKITTLYKNLSGEVFFESSLGEHLVIARTKEIKSTWDPENEVVEFFNTKTCNLTEAYILESNLDWNNNFRGVLAETQDCYIMIYKAFFVVDDDTESDIPAVSDMKPCVGIISKEDFWKRNYKFEEISWNI